MCVWGGGVCRGVVQSAIIVYNPEFSSEGAAGKHNYICAHALHMHACLEGFQ